MQQELFEKLLEKFLDETITSEELVVFLQEIRNNANQETLNEVLAAKLENKAYSGFADNDGMEEILFQTMLKKADEHKKDETLLVTMPPRKKYFSLLQITAAAVIGLIATSVYFLYFNKTNNQTASIKTTAALNKDIQPGGSKAILTLADGTTIILDSAKDGALSQQGNTKVIKLNNGQLAYHSSGTANTQIVYNTISTPKGGTYQVILPDETKVWLNAASSLRFPTAFTGKERNVEITGEAYFEVSPLLTSHDRGGKKIPFIVHVGEMSVEVLGTHFNVMAYNDEKAIKTTLLEGAVEVTKNNNSVLLKPSQQATLTKASNDLRVTDDIDINQETAWIHGMFQFNDEDLPTILRQLSRWYDVEVSFSNAVPADHFTGKISRNASLSNVLKILELSEVHFKIEGRKIIVTS